MLIGAVAMSAHGAARASADVDFLALDASLLRDGSWAAVRALGHVVEVGVGDIDDPLAGVIRVDPEADEPVDIIVGASPARQRGIVERAVATCSVDGVAVCLPEVADLVLLKLYAGGPRDLDDTRLLLGLPGGEHTRTQVDTRVASLSARMRGNRNRVRAPQGR